MLKNIKTKVEANPKSLFLIDGLGALLSAFLLSIVLVKFESFFGMPRKALYILGCIPIFFALFDLYSYFNFKKGSYSYFRNIAVMNICYCCLSVGFTIFHYDNLTLLGWLYFIVELLIVMFFIKLQIDMYKTEKKEKFI